MTLSNDFDFDVKNDIIDTETPLHTDLAAKYKKSFAYYTFRVRLPLTLQSIIEHLENDYDELVKKYEVGTDVDIQKAASELSKLSDAILNNNNLDTFNDKEPDAQEWNTFLNQLPTDKKNYFQTCWLYAECYMYRKISSIFKLTTKLANYDYFSKQKESATIVSTDAMLAVIVGTRNISRCAETFQHLLKLNLWGNRCDLSITSGKEVRPSHEVFEQIADLEAKLLADSTLEIWETLSATKEPPIVDIICDNAGYELFTDLILAEYIIAKGLARKVRFNVKAIPWFISDVMEHDFTWTLEFLRKHKNLIISSLGETLHQFVIDGKIELAPLEYFWTSPYEFYKMQEICPELYQRLSEAQLLIFKGDLNYRKLLGDHAWDSTESFETCLRGFKPTNLCTLRTIKADLICGLKPGLADALNKRNSEWMLTGEYGVIQFSQK